MTVTIGSVWEKIQRAKGVEVSVLQHDLWRQGENEAAHEKSSQREERRRHAKCKPLWIQI